jgi:hypothetical protein
MSPDHFAESKISISYVSTGMPHNDQVLLKSVLSLYGTQGNAVWHNQQPSREVDTIIIGTEVESAEVSAMISRMRDGQIVLWVSDASLDSFEKHHVFQCKPPLRALPLAGKLKQIEKFMRQRLLHSEHMEPLGTACIMLLQWPSAALLSGSKDFLRMATMLSVRHMKFDELVKHSSCSVEKCKDFLHRLHHAGYVRFVEPEGGEPSPQSLSLQTGGGAEKSRLKTLLGKIRASLGFSSE